MSSILCSSLPSTSYSSKSVLLASRRNVCVSNVTISSTSSSRNQSRRGFAQKKIVAMGNVNEGGLFAPLVVFVRPLIGVKRFNQLRGKAISLHSQVIGDFCSEFGATTKQRQRLIKTAKANGGRLGFLAWKKIREVGASSYTFTDTWRRTHDIKKERERVSPLLRREEEEEEEKDDIIGLMRYILYTNFFQTKWNLS